MQVAHRRYARRQVIWLRRERGVEWVRPPYDVEALARRVERVRSRGAAERAFGERRAISAPWPRHPFALEFERPLIALESKIAELKELSGGARVDFSDEIQQARAEGEEAPGRDLQRPDAVADRSSSRATRTGPTRSTTCSRLFTDFFEIEGDRRFAADRAIVGGFARFDGEPVVVMGHQKGRSTKENMLRNFGMPRPEGYRKARRLFELAERFRRPVIIFIDTPGAYPGIGAEERGQAEAIAVNLEVMSSLERAHRSPSSSARAAPAARSASA